MSTSEDMYKLMMEAKYGTGRDPEDIGLWELAEALQKAGYGRVGMNDEQLESVGKIREALVVLAWEFNSLVESLQEGAYDEQ